MNGLGRKVLVAAFDGWNDAGEAASAAVAHLRENGEYEPVFSVDPELYFDYQYTRPQITLDADGRRLLKWPEATILRPMKSTRSTQLWLLTGVEPARAWQAFASEFVDVALREDITGLISLGSMMSDVPHTRPISIFAGSESEQVRTTLDLERSTYEGPVGILSVLSQAADAAGIPSASLWASVPHYVAAAPNPKAALALVRKLEGLVGVSVDAEELERSAADYERQVSLAVQSDPDVQAFVERLEQAVEEEEAEEGVSLDLPSGDVLAREFQRFLRQRGNEPPKPPR